MLPVLLDLKFIKIYTFGVFLVLAFFWGCYMLWKNIRLTSHKEQDIFDAMFVSLVGALFIGRLSYVVFHWSDFGFDLVKFILFNGYPGFSLFGCIMGALAAFAVYTYRKKMKFFELIDYVVSPLLIALAIGKIGAFFSGAEIGTKTKFILSLKYTSFEGFRHLTALYEGVLFFIGAFISYRLLLAIRREQYKKGFLFFFFIWYFSLVYFIFDPLKNERMLFSGHSIQQIIALTLLLTFSAYIIYYMRVSLFKRIMIVKNIFIHHGTTKQTVHSKPTEETARGKDKDS